MKKKKGFSPYSPTSVVLYAVAWQGKSPKVFYYIERVLFICLLIYLFIHLLIFFFQIKIERTAFKKG